MKKLGKSALKITPSKVLGRSFMKEHQEDLKKGWNVTKNQQYEIDHGDIFTKSIGGTNRLQEPGIGVYCFENSKKLYFKLKQEGKNPIYYEGWARRPSGIPKSGLMRHAWIVLDREVIDDTWGPGNFKYLGLPVKDHYVNIKRDYYGWVTKDYNASEYHKRSKN